MELIHTIDPAEVAGAKAIAESDQFALYALEDDTYLLVQRHSGTPWQGVRLSGDGIFRVGALLVGAMRHLYRDMASEVSPARGRG